MPGAARRALTIFWLLGPGRYDEFLDPGALDDVQHVDYGFVRHPGIGLENHSLFVGGFQPLAHRFAQKRRLDRLVVQINAAYIET